MAGGNRSVKIIVSIPIEMQEVIKRYQKYRRLVTFSAALRELLETHPAYVMDVTRLGVYDRSTPEPLGKEVMT